MSKAEKLAQLILYGHSDADISFLMLCKFLKQFGFKERIKGDHHIFTYSTIDEIINIQPTGSKAKAYQIKQIRRLFLKYKLERT